MVKEPRDFFAAFIATTSPYDGIMRWGGSPEMPIHNTVGYQFTARYNVQLDLAKVNHAP